MEPIKKEENQAEEIIRLLMENEMAMQELYLAFAQQFPFFESFWKKIAEEEKRHATWIETLGRGTEAELAQFAERNFPTEAIQQNIRSMVNLKESVVAGNMTLLEGLEKAVHLENGMLENKFFEIFATDAPALQAVFEALRLSTQEHFVEIDRVWKKEKLGSEFEEEAI
jgi:hypothetical protein